VWHGRRVGFGLLIIFVATVGCASRQSVRIEHRGGIYWPEDDPKIELRAILDLQRSSDGGTPKVLRWLKGDGIAEAGLFRRPYGVAWVGDDLLISDPDNSRVARITPRGEVTLSASGLFDTPIGVRSCQQGILVSDSRAGRVAILDDNLKLVDWLAEGLSRPTGIACTDQVVFVAETSAHRILVVSRDGTLRAVGGRGAGLGEFNFPTALEIVGEELLVVDTLNFRVQRMEMRTESFTGAFGELGDAPGELPRPKGIAGDSKGRIWVADGLLDQVAIYSVEGDFLFSIGSATSTPIEFSFPAGIASHPDGRVVAVDSLNQRLIIFISLDDG